MREGEFDGGKESETETHPVNCCVVIQFPGKELPSFYLFIKAGPSLLFRFLLHRNEAASHIARIPTRCFLFCFCYLIGRLPAETQNKWKEKPSHAGKRRTSQ